MANNYKIVTPYSTGYESEREFFINILVSGIELPKEETQQLVSLELDMDKAKATVGKLIIGTTTSPDNVFGRRVANHNFWVAGRKLTLFLGPRGDVMTFHNLYLKEPKYKFTAAGVIVEVKFTDSRYKMQKKKRQRRFKNMSAGKLIDTIAKNYKLTPVIELQGEEQRTIFNDEFNFSQVNQDDAELMDTLCRKFNWRWRVNGNRMELYKTEADANVTRAVAYQLDFRTGECSVAKFSPSIKKVDIPQHTAKIKSKSFTSRILAGGKKGTTPAQKKAEARRLIEQRIAKVNRAKNRPARLVQPAFDAPLAIKEAYWDALQSQAANPVVNPDDVARGPKIIGRQRNTWIHAEAVLAIPTLRIQPRAKVNLACGGSEFFTKSYECTRMKLKVDGRTGGVAVNLFLSVLAWHQQFGIKKRPLGKPELGSGEAGIDYNAGDSSGAEIDGLLESDTEADVPLGFKGTSSRRVITTGG